MLLAAAAVLMVLVIRPMASALFLAAVLAGVLWPAHRWLSARLGGRRSLSGAAFVLGVVVSLLVPVAGFSAFAIKEGTEGVRYVSKTVRDGGVVGLVEHCPPQSPGSSRKDWTSCRTNRNATSLAAFKTS